MIRKNETSDNQAQCSIQNVSSSVDFWQEAQTFLKSQLPKDFEEKLKDYVNEKNFNKNEFMLFEKMLGDAVGFYSLSVRLKHYC